MLYKEENNYLAIANHIVASGYRDKSRTGIDIRKVHAAHMEFSLLEGRVPVLSSRKVPVKSPIVEMIWFISGSTDIKFLKDNNVSIWDSWIKPGTAVYDERLECGVEELKKKGLVKPRADLDTDFFLKYGPGLVNQLLTDLTGQSLESKKLLSGSIGSGAYGAQWRNWEDMRVVSTAEGEDLMLGSGYEHVATLADNKLVVVKKYDQLQAAIEQIKNNDQSRRIIVSAWNPGKLDLAMLPPCHSFFQFLPFEKDGVKYLDLSLTCRSQDFLVGTVFNVFQYGVLCQMVAKLTGRTAHKLYWTGNNTHIYENQVEIFEEQHSGRSPVQNPDLYLSMPQEINEHSGSIDDFSVSNTVVVNYNNYQDRIDYPVAV